MKKTKLVEKLCPKGYTQGNKGIHAVQGAMLSASDICEANALGAFAPDPDRRRSASAQTASLEEARSRSSRREQIVVRRLGAYAPRFARLAKRSFAYPLFLPHVVQAASHMGEFKEIDTDKGI